MSAGAMSPTLQGGVLSTGFSVLDVLRVGSTTQHRAGGTAGNVAANLAWLGVKSALLARVGDDPAGHRFRNDLAAAGVNVRWLRRDSSVETPLVVHEVLGHGRHRFRFSCPDCGRRFASHRPAPQELAAQAGNANPGFLFFDRASVGALSIAEKVLPSRATVMFEPNGIGREQLTIRAMGIATIVKLSAERAGGLMGLLEGAKDCQLQIVTHGADGLEWRLNGESWRPAPAVRGVEVRDSGGAGDWTTAAFIAALIHEERLTRPAIARALKVGQAFGALSCMFDGARGLSGQCTPGEAWGTVTSWTGKVPWRADASVSTKQLRSRKVSCVVCLAPFAD
jgi:fructokinase